MSRVPNFEDLDVYKNAIRQAMRIFEITKGFPKEEKYSLTDQIRRSSRAVCANLAESWRKRRYPAAFIAKLNDAESEASETQSWLDIANRCGYIELPDSSELRGNYHIILSQLVVMARNAEEWRIS